MALINPRSWKLVGQMVPRMINSRKVHIRRLTNKNYVTWQVDLYQKPRYLYISSRASLYDIKGNNSQLLRTGFNIPETLGLHFVPMYVQAYEPVQLLLH